MGIIQTPVLLGAVQSGLTLPKLSPGELEAFRPIRREKAVGDVGERRLDGNRL